MYRIYLLPARGKKRKQYFSLFSQQDEVVFFSFFFVPFLFIVVVKVFFSKAARIGRGFILAEVMAKTQNKRQRKCTFEYWPDCLERSINFCFRGEF